MLVGILVWAYKGCAKFLLVHTRVFSVAHMLGSALKVSYWNVTVYRYIILVVTCQFHGKEGGHDFFKSQCYISVIAKSLTA